MSSKQQGGGKTPMTKADAARIQRAEARKRGGQVEKGTFPTRAQSAADKRSNPPK